MPKCRHVRATWRGSSCAHSRIFNREAVIRACSAFVIALPLQVDCLEKRAECVTHLSGFHIFETQRVSGITGGLWAAAGGGNRPTIGLSEIGPVAAGPRCGAGGDLANWKPGTGGVRAARREGG